jgi:hypothetical protein
MIDCLVELRLQVNIIYPRYLDYMYGHYLGSFRKDQWQWNRNPRPPSVHDAGLLTWMHAVVQLVHPPHGIAMLVAVPPLFPMYL